MSNPIPVEPLERRMLFSDFPTTPPTPTTPPSRPRPPVDVQPNNHAGIRRVGRTLFVVGTAGNDTVRISGAPADGTTQRPGQIQVQLNGSQPVIRASQLRRVVVRGGAGDDIIRIDANLPQTYRPRVTIIRGDDGNDTITGSDRNDRISGDAGNDTLVGSIGNDEIDGGVGDDRLEGGAGADRLVGGDGNDVLIGGVGLDRMFGGVGDDTFLNNEPVDTRQSGVRDLLDGGGGNDSAEADPADQYRRIVP